MKKIIYSIVCALIITVVLALIFPTWFLRGDACRTYLSDTARVDIALIGNVKNSRVTAEGTNARISQPAWFSDGTYQGTVVEVPVSYRRKSYKIKIVPHADECGENASLVFTFRGADIRENDKRMPAWVTFQNISLNGQSSVQRQKVWHNRPFILKYPPHASEVALSFDVHKPFKASDLSFMHITPVFLILLLLSLFPTPLKRIADHVLIFTSRENFAKALLNEYRSIDPVYRRSFWIIFGVLCFAFGLHAIWFMWGNHDWCYLEHETEFLRGAWMGRYMKFAVKVLFSSGIHLPLIYDIMALLVLALNAVLLCKYWHLEKRILSYVVCGLVLTVQPFTLSMLWYIDTIPEVFIGVTCVLVALLLSEKIATGGRYTTRRLIYSLLPIVLINFSLGIYQVLVNTIAVAFIGRILLQAFDWDGSWQSLKSYLRNFTISAVNILLGIASYKLVVSYVFPVRSFYNTDTLPIEDYPERLYALLKQGFHQLYEYNYPFLPQWFLWIFLGFSISLTIHIALTGNVKQKIVRFFLLFGSLFATQTAMLITKRHLIDGRIELFGLVFFEVLVTMLVISQVRRFYNLWLISAACVIFSSVLHDLDCLRVWKLGFDAEKMLWNRILARLEIQKDFVPRREYNIIQIGNPITIRPRFYVGERKEWVNSDHLDILYPSYDAGFNVFNAPEFYYPTRFRGKKFILRADNNDTECVTQLRQLYKNGVLQKAEVWPKPNGLIVWKDVILFVTDERELEKYRKQFERELKGGK